MAGLLGGIDPAEMAMIGGLLSGKKGENMGIHFAQFAAAMEAKKRREQQDAQWQAEHGMRKDSHNMSRQQFEAQQQAAQRQQEADQQRQQAMQQMFQNDPRMAQLAQVDPKMALERQFPKPNMQFAPNGQAVDLSQVPSGQSFAPPEKPDIRFAPNGQVVDMRQVKPGTSFAPPREQREPAGQYDSARGVVIDPRTGQARPVTMPDGSPLAPKETGKADKPLTEGQAKGSMYLGMMKDAEDNVSTIKDFDVTKTNNQTLIAFARGDIKRLPAALQNTSAGEAAQRYVQSSHQWSEAMLRQLTGAAAPPEEIKRNAATYFPQFGDSPGVIRQKNQARKQMTDYLRIIAGPGAEQVDAARAARTPAEDPLGIR